MTLCLSSEMLGLSKVSRHVLRYLYNHLAFLPPLGTSGHGQTQTGRQAMPADCWSLKAESYVLLELF